VRDSDGGSVPTACVAAIPSNRHHRAVSLTRCHEPHLKRDVTEPDSVRPSATSGGCSARNGSRCPAPCLCRSLRAGGALELETRAVTLSTKASAVCLAAGGVSTNAAVCGMEAALPAPSAQAWRGRARARAAAPAVHAQRFPRTGTAEWPARLGGPCRDRPGHDGGTRNGTAEQRAQRPASARAASQCLNQGIEAVTIHNRPPATLDDARRSSRPKRPQPGSPVAPPATMATSSAAGIIVSEAGSGYSVMRECQSGAITQLGRICAHGSQTPRR
jgi:hypothetical protein